jgi:hypothetical protein
VAVYAERTFSGDEVAALADEGLSGLPRNEWEVYQRILSSCAYADRDQLREALGDESSP